MSKLKEKLLTETNLKDEIKEVDDMLGGLKDSYYNAAEGVWGVYEFLKEYKGSSALGKEYKLWEKIKQLVDQSNLGKVL